MSTQVPRQRESAGIKQADFVPVDEPRAMDAEKLNACRETRACAPGDAPDGRTAVYAVAHRQGVQQNHTTDDETEAMNVLYLTADGTHACERWYPREGPADFSNVDRAFGARDEDLSPVGPNVDNRWTHYPAQHPEVQG